MGKRYWIHRNESDIPAATPLLRRGILSIGWSLIATRDEDVIALAQEGDCVKLKTIVENAYGVNYQFTNLKHFAQFKPGDIVVVPMPDDELVIYQIEETPVSIAKYDMKPFNDTDSYEITKAASGLLLRNIEYRDPTVVDIGYVVKAKMLSAKLPRQHASIALRKRMGIPATNNNADDLADDIEKLLAI